MEIPLPVGISEEQAREWLSILVERKVNAELNANPAVAAATAKAKEDIDAYRKQVGLQPKFEKVAEEIKEP
jgi:hypothetical protein